MITQEPFYVVGVDMGTTSLRVGLFTPKGQLMASATKAINLNRSDTGWVEGVAQHYWKALVACMRKVISGDVAPHVAGIVVGSTASTILGSREDGTPCTPVILWMDARAANEALEISNYLHQYTSHEWMLAKALWMSRHLASWEQSELVVELADWINFHLTGQWTASQCTSVCKWNWNELTLRTWQSCVGESELTLGRGLDAELNHISQKWPQLVCAVGTPIGSLTDDAAMQLGLSRRTMVFEGAIDAYLAMIGSNCLTPSSLSLTLGTSTVLLAPSNQPMPSNSIWGPFDSPIVKGQWVVEGGQLSSGILLEWIARLLGTTHQTLSQRAQTIRPGSGGLMWTENIQGNRTPHRHAMARAGLYGLRIDHRPEFIYRAALEATAMGAYEAFTTVVTAAQTKISSIRASGGGALDPLWLQIHADVFGQSLSCPRHPEWAVLRGAAMLAVVGLGYYSSINYAAEAMAPSWMEIRPNEQNHKVYAQLLEVHRDVYNLEKQIDAKLYDALREVSNCEQ